MTKMNFKRATVAMLTSAMLAGAFTSGAPYSVKAATEHWNDASEEASKWTTWKDNWETFSSNYENVSLTPGVDETELNFAYYSHTQEIPKVKLAVNADMSDAVEFTGTQETGVVISDQQYYSNKITAKDLKENTQYYYQVWQNGEWSQVEEYSTKSFSEFSFLYVGDPQIGASKGQTSSEGDTMNYDKGMGGEASDNLAARNDSYNWNEILKDAVKDHKDVSFMVSAGDQINYAQNEREYAGYLGADALRSLPVATTIGNHDSTSNQYSLHYNNPNSFTADQTSYTEGKTEAGTDYYYRYGNVLFIVLDTNNYNCATHKNVIEKAVNENKDAKWRVVTFHQDIYGSGYDHSDSDGMILRTQLTPIMDEYDIDVVLQGHDHTYSRTYQLQGDGKEHTAYGKDNTGDYGEEFQAQNICYEIVNNTKSGTVVNPKGTVYLEANSSTGSKFYELIATQQDYISERSQTWTPTYSVVNVTDDSFSVTVYDGSTGKELDGSSTYTIVKKDQEKQTISGTASYKKTYGDKAFTLNAKTNGDGKLTYATSDKKVAMVDSKGKVTIKGTGKATITVTAAETDTYQKATKKITITVVPKKQTASVSNKTKGSIKVSWKKDTKATGYEIVYASNKSFTKGVKTVKISKNATTSYSIKDLKKGKSVYVKVRSYKVADGKHIHGLYSTVKTATVK